MNRKVCIFDYVVCAAIAISLFVPFYKVYKDININSQNIPFSLQSKIMSGFRFSPYRNEIQNTYVSEIDKSELKILVKPNSWKTLDENDKNRILKIANKKWSKIFRTNNSDIAMEPKVAFANK